jgi:hypothetical protein
VSFSFVAMSSACRQSATAEEPDAQIGVEELLPQHAMAEVSSVT